MDVERTVLTDFIRLGDGVSDRKINITGAPIQTPSALIYPAKVVRKEGYLAEYYPLSCADSVTRDEVTKVPCSDNQWEYPTGLDAFDLFFESLIHAVDTRPNSPLAHFLSGIKKLGDFDDKSPSHYAWIPKADGIPFTECYKVLCAQKDLSPANALREIYSLMHAIAELADILYDAQYTFDIAPDNILISFNKNGEIFALPNDMSTIRIYDYNGAGSDMKSLGEILYSMILSYEKDEYTHIPLGDNLPAIRSAVRDVALVKRLSLVTTGKGNKAISIPKRCAGGENMFCDYKELLGEIEIAVETLNGILKIAEEKKKIDIDRINAKLAMLYHLYDHPLFEYFQKSGFAPSVDMQDTKPVNLNVLLLGFGYYGELFMDLCLQLGQMHGIRLNVAVVCGNTASGDTSGDAEARALAYRQERPELTNFFHVKRLTNVKGLIQSGDPDCYGEISFHPVVITEENAAETLADIKKNEFGGEPIHYIFTALGDDNINLKIASTVRKSDVCDGKTSIAFAYDTHAEHIEDDAKSQCLMPVMTKSEARRKDIDRMGFNANLIWHTGWRSDFSSAADEFYNDSYNNLSSLIFAVSIIYKMYSTGMDVSVRVPDLLASEFYYKTAKAGAAVRRKMLDIMAYIGHKRWVAEKICDGWRKMDVTECESGKTKSTDEKTGVKKHICLVHGRADHGISGNIDEIDDKAYAKLDALDRLTVDYHREMVKRTSQMSKNGLFPHDIIAQISRLIAGNTVAESIFREVYCCMTDIFNKQTAAVGYENNIRHSLINEYRAAMRALADAVAPASDASKEEIESSNEVLALISKLSKAFTPVCESRSYTDFKRKDDFLIESIPFILTYNSSLSLMIPAATNPFTSIHNIIPPTILAPEKVVYSFLVRNNDEFVNMKQRIKFLSAYMLKKRFRTKIAVFIAYYDTVTITRNDFMKEIRAYGTNIEHVEIAMYDPRYMHTLIKQFSIFIEKNMKSEINLYEINDEPLSLIFLGAGIYESCPCYSYKQDTMSMLSVNRGGMVIYPKSYPGLTVTDIAMSTGSYSPVSTSSHPEVIETYKPEFFDTYEALWDTYHSHKRGWKQLCKALSGKDEDGQTYMPSVEKSLILSYSEDQKAEIFKIRIAPALIPYAKRITDTMKENNMISPGSYVRSSGVDSCEVYIEYTGGSQDELAGLFTFISEMSISDRVEFLALYDKRDRAKKFIARMQKLKLVDVALPAGEKGIDYEVYQVLKKLQDDLHYITFNKQSNGLYTVTFSTHAVRDLLVSEGKMLEIYIYHKLLSTGEFDDVVSGYKIYWNGKESLENEFDCIAVKGFNVFLIECKARSLESDPYYKLSNLSHLMGSCVIPVIVADYSSNADSTKAAKSRGDFNGIYTFTQDDIDNIGDLLLSLIPEEGIDVAAQDPSSPATGDEENPETLYSEFTDPD